MKIKKLSIHDVFTKIENNDLDDLYYKDGDDFIKATNEPFILGHVPRRIWFLLKLDDE